MRAELSGGLDIAIRPAWLAARSAHLDEADAGLLGHAVAAFAGHREIRDASYEHAKKSGSFRFENGDGQPCLVSYRVADAPSLEVSHISVTRPGADGAIEIGGATPESPASSAQDKAAAGRLRGRLEEAARDDASSITDEAVRDIQRMALSDDDSPPAPVARAVSRLAREISDEQLAAAQERGANAAEAAMHAAANDPEVIEDMQGMALARLSRPQPSRAANNAVTAAQAEIAEGLRRTYFRRITGIGMENAPALREFLHAVAAVAIEAGCKDFAQTDRVLRKAMRHNRIVRVITGSLAGSAGYSLGMWTFIRQIAPHLPPLYQHPVMLGLLAGHYVGTLDSSMATMFRAAGATQLYGGGEATQVEGVRHDAPRFAESVVVTAGLSALWTGLKNLSRVAAPPIMHKMYGELTRSRFGLVDLGLDSGLGFGSAALSAWSGDRILNKDQVQQFLMQENFAEEFRTAAGPNSARALAVNVKNYASAFVSAVPRAFVAPSNVAATLYIAGMVSTLIYANSRVAAAHQDSGLPPTHMSPAEGWQRGMVSTGMMSGLAGGATAIGMTVGRYVDDKATQAVGRYAKKFAQAFATAWAR